MKNIIKTEKGNLGGYSFPLGKDEAMINGKLYRLVPVEPELTLEDCVDGNKWFMTQVGTVDEGLNQGFNRYPNQAIAEKVLLYGLLCSVAHKLNETGRPTDPKTFYEILLKQKQLVIGLVGDYDLGQPMFPSIETANQAISIFAKSKFDLKKLYQ